MDAFAATASRRQTGARAVTLGLTVLCVGLSACGRSESPNEHAEPFDQATAQWSRPPLEGAPAAAPPDRPQATTGAGLPDGVTGTFDESEVRCAEPVTVSRLIVAQDTVEFYYGYATVDTVSFRNGGYDVGATLYQLEGAVEVRPEVVTYRIEPGAGGGDILFGAVSAGRAPSPLVRCSEP